MYDGGTISIKINADASQANKALEDMKFKIKTSANSFRDLDKYSKLDMLGNQFTKVGTKLTNFVTKPALAAGAALGAIALKKGWERLKSIDDAKAKLEGLGHSGNEVKIIMDNALESVKGTSFGLGEAAGVAASAVAAGIKPGKELTKWLKLTGDAAAIAGMDMESMGAIFNKVATQGKLTSREVQQLSKAGIPIMQLLAKATGKSMDEVRASLSKGEIGAEEFQKAIEVGMGGAAKTMGEKTLSGSIKNLGAALGRLGASFLDAGGKGGGFFSQLKPMLKKATDQIDKLGPAAEKMGVKFGKAFKAMLKIIKQINTPFGKFVATTILAAGPMLKLTGNTMKAMVALKKFQTVNKGASLALGVMSGKITGGQVAMGKFGEGVSKALTKLKSMPKVMGAIPWAAAIAGAVALGVAIYKTWQHMHKYSIESDNMVKKNKAAITATKEAAETAEFYGDKLVALNKKQNKTAGDIQLMKSYVEQLNSIYPDLNLAVDKNTGKVTSNGKEIKNLNKYLQDNIKLLRQQAEAEARQKNLKRAADTLVKHQDKAETAKDNVDNKKAKMDSLDMGSYSWQQARNEWKAAQAEYDDLVAAVIKDTQEVNKQEVKVQGWDNIAKDAKAAGIKMTDSLKKSIKQGQMKLPTSAKEWKKALQLQQMVDEAKKSGKQIPKSVSNAMAKGDYSKGIKKMKKVVGDGTKEAAKESNKQAKKNPTKFKADTKDVDNKIKLTNKKKLDKKVAQLNGDNKKAISAITKVNNTKMPNKKNILDAKDEATAKINSVNNKKLKNKTLSIKAVISGLTAKAKKFLGLRRGTREIPYDGYQAELHKGERVLTASENNQYEQMLKGINANLDTQGLANALLQALSGANMTVVTQVDGRTLAQTTAPFMSQEINKIDYRANRKLGYV